MCEKKLDFSKPIRTRGGKEVVIFTTSARDCIYRVYGEYKTDNGHWKQDRWTIDGQINNGHTNDLDLVNYEPEQFRYVNIYKGTPGNFKAYVDDRYKTRKDADDGAGAGNERVGCIKVKLEARWDE